MSFQPILLSLKLAFITSLLLFLIVLPLAYFFQGMPSKTKRFFLTVSNLPLVLPPSVLGFYFLLLFRPESSFAIFVDSLFGISLLFSFQGLVLASIVYSFPFMLNPIVNALDRIPKQFLESSYFLGASKIKTFFRISLPLIKPSLISGFVMSFAHTIGEFGVILMIGGNVPKETNVASIAIFNEVEQLNFSNAHNYSLLILLISFLILLLLHMFSKTNWLAK